MDECQPLPLLPTTAQDLYMRQVGSVGSVYGSVGGSESASFDT